MGWKIDDGRPIWTQLKEQMIKRIVSGTYIQDPDHGSKNIEVSESGEICDG